MTSSQRPGGAAPRPPTSKLSDALFSVGGEVAGYCRDLDWAATPLGGVAQWPQSLRTVVSLVLTSRFPMWMGFGPELTFLYNDAYGHMTLGAKHPWALGKPANVVWAEIWKDIGPRIAAVMKTGDATWDEALLLFLERSGYPEETYHTFSYSPVADDGGIVAGMLCVVSEDTERVIGERRLDTLRELAAGLASVTREDQALAAVSRTLSRNGKDLPFTLTYLFDGDPVAEASSARLGCATGIRSGHAAAPAQIAYEKGLELWPIEDMRAGHSHIVVEDLDARFAQLPFGDWDRAPTRAVVMPIAQPGQDRAAGFFVAAVNPYRPLADDYVAFLRLVAGQIGAGLANARAYEEERRRAEQLAALDRAKTQFFSNVSHEFRTPLTLLLGPTEDAINDPDTTPQNRERISLIHRNALRLLRLVNTLLDFSRIEAGRVRARFEPTDLGQLTADLASSFRSAIERAGLRLTIDVAPAPASLGPVYVDREMWEKIVLNLLSNAFKHTFDGEIDVRLRADGRDAVLEVRDTGVGISAEQLPHIFERFHRVPNARSRTHEGTGIGLALVQELVRLHGGSIDVTSEPGVGTTFSVRVPTGASHLPADHVTGPLPRAEAAQVRMSTGAMYVEEALRWLPNDDAPGDDGDTTGDVGDDTAKTTQQPLAGTRVLVADDNADMRDYVTRLLRQRGCRVDAVADGEAALAHALSNTPDLILSDVMMPGLDGFELLRAVREDPRTRSIPVILLSARAGEEARVEGIEAGADDYLVKPFSARELVARVEGRIELHRMRREREEERERLLASVEAAREVAEEANRAKSDFLAAMSHELRTPLNAIGGYAQLIALGIHGPVSEAQLQALQRLQRSQQHLLSLINDVLNFAKLEAGRVEYAMAPVSLADAVQAVAPMIEPQLQEKRIEYAVEVDGTAVVQVDPEKLQQILLNLLSNAIKFTDRGGQITVSTSRVDSTRDQFALKVRDTGIGIAREKHESIFDPFVQAHRNLTSSTEGTGLGLAISRDLARAMGGELSVESEPGKGATFTLTMRAADTNV